MRIFFILFDKMSLFNNTFDEINLIEFLLLIIILFIVQFCFDYLKIIHIDSAFLYILVIIYFVFKLKKHLFLLKNDFKSLLSLKLFLNILIIVMLNILLSYGFLYFSNFVLNSYNNLNFFSSSYFKSSLTFGSLISVVLISPICEELIFRGVFLTKLKSVVPLIFAVLISSLLFAALHNFGSITSAFIFGICMAILYLKTNNILVPIFAHLLNNLISESILVLGKGGILFNNSSVMTVMSLLAIVSLILILIYIFKELKTLNNTKS